jgi:hypothetical protein
MDVVQALLQQLNSPDTSTRVKAVQVAAQLLGLDTSYPVAPHAIYNVLGSLHDLYTLRAYFEKLALQQLQSYLAVKDFYGKGIDFQKLLKIVFIFLVIVFLAYILLNYILPPLMGGMSGVTHAVQPPAVKG